MTNEHLLNVNCQGQLGEISQWHQQESPAFSTKHVHLYSYWLTPTWQIYRG